MKDLATNKLITPGIVLDEQAYGESSKILRIFTRERGKLSVMAKGAYRSRSKLLSLTQPMVEGEYFLTLGKSFAYIRDGKIIEDHRALESNFKQLLTGTFILEVIDKALEYGQVNKKIYGLTKKTLEELEKGFSKTLVNAFLIKVLSFLGYRPILGQGNQINFKNIRPFDPKSGIIEYGLKAKDGRIIQEEDVDYIEKILYSPLDQLPTINCNEDFIFQLLIDLLRTHLDVYKINTYDLLVTF